MPLICTVPELPLITSHIVWVLIGLLVPLPPGQVLQPVWVDSHNISVLVIREYSRKEEKLTFVRGLFKGIFLGEGKFK